jgi:hypothetical protein
MKRRRLSAAGVVAGATAMAAMTAVPFAQQAAAPNQAAPQGQTWTVPRTAWGAPDLQGVWTNNNATPLERPKELADRQFLTDQEVESLKRSAAQLFDGNGDAAFGDSVFVAALRNAQGFTSTDTSTGNYNQFWLVDRDFDNRTSLITDPPDGRIPALTAENQRKQAATAERRKLRPADGPESFSLSLRCITFGLPNTFAGYNSYYQFVQSPEYVVIFTELIHDARIIPLDGRPHLPQGVRQWLGNSRGRWEGDTLVVETTNFVDQSMNGMSALRVSGDENMRLVERFTRVGPETIHYEFTIDDPTMWTRPWTAMIPLRHSTDQIYEFACHEGNHSMTGSLSGARYQEREAAAKGSK